MNASVIESPDSAKGHVDSFPAHFPPTQWTLIGVIQQDGPSSPEALEKVCRHYWVPVYSYARGLGLSPVDAEDVTQEFFLGLVEGRVLRDVSSAMGKLRSYIMVCVKNLARRRDRRAAAKKRGGHYQIQPLALDELEKKYAQDVISTESPERSLERRWALTVMDEAMEQLHSEYCRRGDADVFKIISKLLTNCDRGNSYRQAALKLQLKEGTIRAKVFRMRKRFGEIVRTILGDSIRDPADLDAELSALPEILATVPWDEQGALHGPY